GHDRIGPPPVQKRVARRRREDPQPEEERRLCADEDCPRTRRQGLESESEQREQQQEGPVRSLVDDSGGGAVKREDPAEQTRKNAREKDEILAPEQKQPARVQQAEGRDDGIEIPGLRTDAGHPEERAQVAPFHRGDLSP